jgi:SAM-dependent methyltransferase
MAATPFDALARQYDHLWTESAVGRFQREAVWRQIEALLSPGDRILDLGCGTGADAAHFEAMGMFVEGIDASPEMVRVAQAKGIHAECLAIENLDRLRGVYDVAISNFGALNCVERLDSVSHRLGSRIRRGGILAICVMGPLCVWEVCHFLRQGKPGKAFRRCFRKPATSSLGARVWYPSVSRIKTAFAAEFVLSSWCGIGLFVPPSYVKGLGTALISKLASLDSHVAGLPGLRAWCDHRLLIFERR